MSRRAVSCAFALTLGALDGVAAAHPETARKAAPGAFTLAIAGPDARSQTHVSLDAGCLAPGGTERRWRLSLDATALAEQPASDAEPASNTGRTLVLGQRAAPLAPQVAPLVATLVPPGQSGSSFPLDPLERTALGEMERARSYGGPHDWSRPAMLVSLPALVEVIRGAVRAARARRLPEGARAGRGRTLRVLAVEASGGAPQAVTVTALVLGWVAPPVGGPCDLGGACEVAGLPEAAFTALVIGDGAALVDVPAGVDVVAATLRPLGVLRLLPASAGSDLVVRVTDGASRLAVPTHPSLNHGRREWLPVGAGGATVVAPAGSYVVEARAGAADARRLEVSVPAGVTTSVTLPAP